MLFVFFSISLSSRIGASLAISLSLAFCFSLYICSFFNVASDENLLLTTSSTISSFSFLPKRISILFDKLFEFALENGIKEFEAFYAEGSSFSVKIFNGIVDDYKNL
jgi:hypothetical protein